MSVFCSVYGVVPRSFVPVLHLSPSLLSLLLLMFVVVVVDLCELVSA